ncbi:surface lipoprotein assembly modifier [Pseudooceanicola sp.]|uniref:surface lipoprotein assembly modifier n=1 Tax=Pseudooceanicola sp. TaxID=1914328 RepID=UPI0035C667BA
MLRRLALALTLLGGLVLGPARAEEVSVAQARTIGVSALQQGRLDLAEEVALGLLQRDGGDAFAHLLLARVRAAQARPKEARRALRLAFREADKPMHKFQAAQMAARMAFEQDSLTVAQLWLRRSLAYAPSEAHESVVVRDYRILRVKNPLSLGFDFSVAPSSNVNNGAESSVSVIEGLPFVGQLSPSAQALSGVVTTAEGRLSYRLAGSRQMRTDLSLKLGTRQVRLSDAARAAAPTVTNSDLSSTTAEAGLSYLRKVGEGSVRAETSVARSWQNGAARQDVVTTALTYGRKLSETLTWQGGLTRDWRIARLNRFQDQQGWTARSTLGFDLPSGDQMALSVSYRATDSADGNRRSDRWLAYASYQPEKPIGPADVTLRIGAASQSYDDYMVGLFAVPGGRQDETWFANVDMVFTEFDYGGFAPAVTLSAQRTSSNVSHFTSKQMAITVGVRSAF